MDTFYSEVQSQQDTSSCVSSAPSEGLDTSPTPHSADATLIKKPRRKYDFESQKKYTCLTPEFWTKYRREEKQLNFIVAGGSIPGRGSVRVSLLVNNTFHSSEWISCDEELHTEAGIRIPFVWSRGDNVHIIVYRSGLRNPESVESVNGRVVAAIGVDIDRLDQARLSLLHLIHSETPYVTTGKAAYPSFTLRCRVESPPLDDKVMMGVFEETNAAGVCRGTGMVHHELGYE